MKLGIPQLASIAAAAGFSGDDLVTAVSVALAESDGNPAAYDPERAAGAPQGAGSFGLWQIFLAKHPEFRGLNLTDPQTNANAAFSVFFAAGDSWHPWATFTSGAYLSYVDQVRAALAPPPDAAAAGDAPSDPTYTPSDGGNLGMWAVGAIALLLAWHFWS